MLPSRPYSSTARSVRLRVALHYESICHGLDRDEAALIAGWNFLGATMPMLGD